MSDVTIRTAGCTPSLTSRFVTAWNIIERGWCQGCARSPSNRSNVCLDYAIAVAADGHYLAMRTVVYEILQLSNGLGNIVTWNDAPNRKKRTVLNALEACIRVCRQRGL